MSISQANPTNGPHSWEMDDSTVDEINVLKEVDEMEDLVIDVKKEESFEPYERMEFPSQEAAYDFYNMYGYISKFSIHTHTYYKNAKGCERPF